MTEWLPRADAPAVDVGLTDAAVKRLVVAVRALDPPQPAAFAPAWLELARAGHVEFGAVGHDRRVVVAGPVTPGAQQRQRFVSDPPVAVRLGIRQRHSR